MASATHFSKGLFGHGQHAQAVWRYEDNSYESKRLLEDVARQKENNMQENLRINDTTWNFYANE